MTKGRKPKDVYSTNTSMALPPEMWERANSLRHTWGVPRSVVYRRAIAVLLDNPGLWEAWLETATPEQIEQVERGA